MNSYQKINSPIKIFILFLSFTLISCGPKLRKNASASLTFKDSILHNSPKGDLYDCTPPNIIGSQWIVGVSDQGLYYYYRPVCPGCSGSEAVSMSIVSKKHVLSDIFTGFIEEWSGRDFILSVRGIDIEKEAKASIEINKFDLHPCKIISP